MDPGETLGWMREHGADLRRLVAEEVEAGGGEDAPAGDPAIRGHLRFLALALEHTLDEPWRDLLAGFADALGPWFAEGADLFDDHLAAGEGAMLLETHLQFGTQPGVDPSLDVSLERRLRLTGWSRIFLLGLEGHLGPAGDGVSERVLAWMDGRQRELGRTVVSMDVQARHLAGQAGG
ncbi:MAG: hypothetical protein RLN63_00350, partial [Miltoncostaeaceae bacterium]